MQRPIEIFIGYDAREQVATEVAAHSIRRRTKSLVNIQYLKHRDLRLAGLFTREWLIESKTGNYKDLVDGRPFSTEFSHTRFLVPALMEYKGWALFMDADMIVLSDIKKLFELCDDKYAVMCVKHNHRPAESIKMDKQPQAQYERKNWSSFVLWNCAHPANDWLSVDRVNRMSGRELHTFSWLGDNLIGEIPFTYNYINKVSPKLPIECAGKPHVMHYTDGGPWFEECKNVPYAHLWLDEYEDFQREREEPYVTHVATMVCDRKDPV
jgi:lipopolysaccharide biosynthesis glycosyltransferase